MAREAASGLRAGNRDTGRQVTFCGSFFTLYAPYRRDSPGAARAVPPNSVPGSLTVASGQRCRSRCGRSGLAINDRPKATRSAPDRRQNALRLLLIVIGRQRAAEGRAPDGVAEVSGNGWGIVPVRLRQMDKGDALLFAPGRQGKDGVDPCGSFIPRWVMKGERRMPVRSRPIASPMAVSTSWAKRIRLFRLPPYSSVRWLAVRRRNWSIR